MTRPELQAAPESICTFLAEQDFDAALVEIRSHTSTPAAFAKRFFRWFDGFRTMKFVHNARDKFYGEEEVEVAGAKLLDRLGRSAAGDSRCELLLAYRKLDRGL
jgi:hypothetical protein